MTSSVGLASACGYTHIYTHPTGHPPSPRKSRDREVTQVLKVSIALPDDLSSISSAISGGSQLPIIPVPGIYHRQADMHTHRRLKINL